MAKYTGRCTQRTLHVFIADDADRQLIRMGEVSGYSSVRAGNELSVLTQTPTTPTAVVIRGLDPRIHLV
jgi:hypothetical protein